MRDEHNISIDDIWIEIKKMCVKALCCAQP